MKERSRVRLAWGLWALTMGLVAAVVILMALDPTPEEEAFLVVVYPTTVVAFASVGAIIASRRGDNPIGWLLLVFAVNFALAGAT